MMRTFFVLLFLVFSTVLFSQDIERKIIIENGNFYFTAIDNETQVATLFTGKDSSSVKTAKKLALPAGRNFTDPINPFAWDITDKEVYAVNFLMHPLNDRNEAIKRMSIASVKEWETSTSALDLIMQGTEMSPFAYNDPYLFVTRRSNTMNNFFFDAVSVNDSSYCMAIANNGELSIWNYNGREWKHSEVQNFPVTGFFSLFAHGKDVYLATNAGGLYTVSLSGISDVKNKSVGTTLSSCFLILNKDDDSIWYMKNSDLNNYTRMSELIKKKAIRIF